MGPGTTETESNLTRSFSVYYEEIKREVNRRRTYECRCDERLRVKVEGSTRLVYTEFRGGLENVKIDYWFIMNRESER